jgi:hypothetical protein
MFANDSGRMTGNPEVIPQPTQLGAVAVPPSPVVQEVSQRRLGSAMAGWRGNAVLLSHEAHHRGQVCMLARQLGFPLPIKVTSGIWNWEKLWKECGSPGGPGCDS